MSFYVEQRRMRAAAEDDENLQQLIDLARELDEERITQAEAFKELRTCLTGWHLSCKPREP